MADQRSSTERARFLSGGSLGGLRSWLLAASFVYVFLLFALVANDASLWPLLTSAIPRFAVAVAAALAGAYIADGRSAHPTTTRMTLLLAGLAGAVASLLDSIFGVFDEAHAAHAALRTPIPTPDLFWAAAIATLGLLSIAFVSRFPRSTGGDRSSGLSNVFLFSCLIFVTVAAAVFDAWAIYLATGAPNMSYAEFFQSLFNALVEQTGEGQPGLLSRRFAGATLASASGPPIAVGTATVYAAWAQRCWPEREFVRNG
ncbi:MAG: hypothetical protein ACFB00_06425 [Parvularculaceae bacterium]